MDSVYVVEVEVTGFAKEGDVDLQGEHLTKKQAETSNEEKLDAFDQYPDVVVGEPLVRDDGTGILYFHWDPPPEAADDGAQTWMAAKGYTERILSVVRGAGFPIVEHRIGTWAADT